MTKPRHDEIEAAADDDGVDVWLVVIGDVDDRQLRDGSGLSHGYLHSGGLERGKDGVGLIGSARQQDLHPHRRAFGRARLYCRGRRRHRPAPDRLELLQADGVRVRNLPQHRLHLGIEASSLFLSEGSRPIGLDVVLEVRVRVEGRANGPAAPADEPLCGYGVGHLRHLRHVDLRVHVVLVVTGSRCR